jgi:peptide/nickel transport system permease protein
MTRYVLRRLLQAIPTFFGVTLLTFIIVYSAPGDPVLQMTSNPRISNATRQEMRHLLGLDLPLPVQYLNWMIGTEWRADSDLVPRKGILRGDFGVSIYETRPVTEIIAERVGATLLLSTTAVLIGYLFGIPIGVYAAIKRGSVFDNATRVMAVFFNSVPGFWLSLVVIVIFAVKFSEWGLPHIATGGMYTLTTSGTSQFNLWDRLVHLLPPALVLATGPIAGISRLMRTQVLEVLSQDYIRTARAKGLSDRTVHFAHALRNALIPLATILGPTITSLIAGSVITETIWSWPGMGRLLVNASFSRDYPLIMAGFVMATVATILGILISDILYGVFDPRIRLE